jgi:hypothetical protein
MRQVKEQVGPEVVAIGALAFIAEDRERLERFLALTGLQAESIRTAAQQPGFLSGVLQQLVGWEPWLIEFAASAGIAPADVIHAAEQLAAETRRGC